MIDQGRADLSVSRQCQLLKLSRSSLYYAPVGINAETLELVKKIDKIFTTYPSLEAVRSPPGCAGTTSSWVDTGYAA